MKDGTHVVGTPPPPDNSYWIGLSAAEAYAHWSTATVYDFIEVMEREHPGTTRLEMKLMWHAIDSYVGVLRERERRGA